MTEVRFDYNKPIHNYNKFSIRITLGDKESVMKYLFKINVTGVDFNDIKKKYDYLSFVDTQNYIFDIINNLNIVNYSYSYLADCELNKYNDNIITYFLEQVPKNTYRSKKYGLIKNKILCNFIDNGYFWYISEMINNKMFTSIGSVVKRRLKFIKDHELNDDLISLNELQCYELLKKYL